MKNKITILIIASILGLIALSSIQAYLISNTYELKKAAFIEETEDAISEIDNIETLDSIYQIWGDNLKDLIADYENERIPRSSIIKGFQDMADSLNPEYKIQFKKELNKINLGYDVDFKVNITSITLLDEVPNDTLYVATSNKKIRLFGKDFKEDEANVIHKARWFTVHEFTRQYGEDIRTSSFDLEVRTENIILIKDWKRIVYGRMAALFFGSVILFLFVIALLYYSIKNLVTQKKIAEIKTDFINNITHELKTPLATLSIATKSLKNETIKANPTAFNSTLNIVDRQNERLQKLIDQVMTNSLSNEDLALNKEQIVDNVYFNNIIEDFKLSKQYNGLTIKNEVYTSEILLRLDKFHFATAILNILENAVKYSIEPTIITFKTELKNGNYCLKISDNGIGISEKNQKHLFDKFYRVCDGDIHDVKGLGLGLYYTSQIIKAHNGTISINSEFKKGTTFIITIPVN